MSEHVIRRGARYYYRRRVPVELVEKLDGKREIQRALGTSDPKEASVLARRVGVEIDELFERARYGVTAHAAPAPRMDPSSLSSAHEDELYPPRESELAPITEQDRILAAQRSALREFKEDLSLILANARQRTRQASTSGLSMVSPAQPAGPATPSLNDAFAAWERLREPTPATKETMRRVIGLFRQSKGPAALSDISISHVRAMIASFTGALNTRRAYLSMFKALLSAAVSAELVTDNAAANVRIEGKDTGGKARVPFTVKELQGIVVKLPSTGAGRWLFLVALYSGMRMSEIGQLTRDDIKREHWRDAEGKDRHTWVMYATDEGEGQRVKNRSSKRRVPLHSELVRLGFVDFIRTQEGRIFPELEADQYGRITSSFGRSFGKLLRGAYGVTDERKTFHSTRHNVKHALREAGVHEDVSDALTGHTSGSAARGYGDAYFPLRPLCEAVESISYHGLKLSD